MAEEQQEVVIVGAGIAGLATAVALKRVGIQSLVLERYHELRVTGAGLTLFSNAWRALDALGVAHKLTPIYEAIQKGRVTNIETGATQEVDFSGTSVNDGFGVRSVHRSALLEALAEELPPGTIRFSTKIASIKSTLVEDSSDVQVLHLEGGATIRAKVLIGCDGVHSVVAQWLGLTPPIDSGRSAVRGISIFPEGHGFKTEIQQFLGFGKRAGFIPLNDTELYWFIALRSTPEQELLRDPDQIQKIVIGSLAKEFPSDYLNVVRHSDLQTLTWAPLLFRRPWDLILGNAAHKGGVVVAGDAMHPMTPDLGQGGCLALEDAVVLGRCIGRARGGKDVGEGMEMFVKERRWRVAGLIAGAYMSGWVQQGGSGVLSEWAVTWFRDHVFYRFLQPWIVRAVNYDCGDLSSGKQ